MQVTSRKNVHFPKFSWGINKGETRDLPASPEAQKAIMAHTAITVVSTSRPTEAKKKVEPVVAAAEEKQETFNSKK